VADDSSGTVAVIGPGRAGPTIALALQEHGRRTIAVAGRAPDAPSTLAAAACLGAPSTLLTEAARGASLVIVSTPDAAIERAARAIATTVEPGALVIHLAGSRGLDAFAELATARPDVRIGALHPLQTIPSVSEGLERLPGSWAAVAGDPEVERLARLLGMRPFPVTDDDRVTYHAAAVIASNHLVALLGQVERLAARAGVPFDAFRALADAAVANAFELGPARALTGPVARGDLATVERHLRGLDPAERDAYRAVAREAARLADRRDTALDRLLDDLRAKE
jgi:predicted short-subunit dehydrogenase-like oxidoreductase (DUF2520 family)